MTWLRLIGLIGVALALPGPAVSAATPAAQAADQDCSDFPNQAAAQQYFLDHGGPATDPDNLDDVGPGDGIACESLPCPCSDATDLPKPKGRRIPAIVIAHTDGDTFKVRRRKAPRRVDRVRLIGIDTPETKRPGVQVECGGPEASESLGRLAPVGSKVLLRTDPTQATRDRYGRLLTYAQRKGRDLGLRQIRRGWADVYVYAARQFKRAKKYHSAATLARREGRGVHEHCDGDFHAPETSASRCDTITFDDRRYVFYKTGLTCKRAKANARKVRRHKQLEGWTCESASNFTTGGQCRRDSSKLFGWHPFD